MALIGIWLAAAALPTDPIRAAPPECRIRLTDVTAQTGIGFVHTDGGGGRRYIVESVVAGLALFDYDGDGLLDIYFTSGAPLPGTPLPGASSKRAPRHALYRNMGGWRFNDVTESAGIAERGYGLGVAAGDYDDDGDWDLYLSNFGPNVLYGNNGDGTFSRATAEAGVGRGSQVGAGACWFDMDADGDLDLYAANYVDFTFERHVVRTIGKHQFHPGPKDYQPVAATLFQNNGDGTFADVSRQSGIGAVPVRGMGAIALDYDDDGDCDLFVANDAGPNQLWRNGGRGTFAEVATLAGVAYDIYGKEHSNMGVECGDYDNDGRLDLFVTSFSSESPLLFRNLGGGLFDDATNRAGAGARAFPHADWGTGLVDFDNDGDRDLFIACGHFNDNIRHIDDRTAVKVRNILLMNTGGGRFVDVSDRCGDGLAVVESTRGAAFDDLDNDGDIDAVLLNANAPPTILRNDSLTDHHWLTVKLRGIANNRQGIGSRVKLTAGGRVQVAEVHSGRGYQSHYGTALHFGLAEQERIDRIEVRWPGRRPKAIADLAADQLLFITESKGDE